MGVNREERETNQEIDNIMQRLREWERHREKQRKRQTDPKREERIMEWYIDWQTDGGENDRNIDENETLPQKVLLHCVLCLSTLVICASQKKIHY